MSPNRIDPFRRPVRPSTPVRAMALVTALALAAGCADENEEPEGGVIDPPPTDSAGTMRGFVTDDPGSGTASASSGAAAEYSGTLSGNGDVEISADERTWYTIGATRAFTIALQDDEAVEMTEEVELPADTYRFVRINFSGVEAVLDAGSTVEGRTLDSPVHLRLGDTGSAVTAQEVAPFELAAGSAARIVLDLNSERWVSADNLERRQIPKDLFEDEAQIEIVGES